MKNLLNEVLWGNQLWDYLVVMVSIGFVWILLKMVKRKLLSVLKKVASRSASNFDDVMVEIAERFVIPYIYLLINYNIIKALRLTPFLEKILTSAFLCITMYFIVRLVNFFIHRSVVGYMEQKNEPTQRIKQVTGMLLLVKIFAWLIGFVMLVDNLGYDITAVIAGLGVGGIAIALAAQNILGDLFSYFVIFFDKPFEIGDFIIIDNNSGVVEKIGIKTSHVRSLDGQQLIMPNAEMVKSVIQNYKRLEKRRIVFSIGVVYATASEKLKKIPEIIQDIIEKDQHSIFDRTHLKSFGDFSINYEIVYYIESADYLLFMNTNQNICIQIFEQFETEGIEFAFPTQTLFVKDNNLDRESRRRGSYAQ